MSGADCSEVGHHSIEDEKDHAGDKHGKAGPLQKTFRRCLLRYDFSLLFHQDKEKGKDHEPRTDVVKPTPDKHYDIVKKEESRHRQLV